MPLSSPVHYFPDPTGAKGERERLPLAVSTTELFRAQSITMTVSPETFVIFLVTNLYDKCWSLRKGGTQIGGAINGGARVHIRSRRTT